MAQFNAEIAIKASVEQALKGVSQIEKAIAKIQDTTIKVKAIGTKDIQQAVRSFNVLQTTLKNTAKTVLFVGKNFAALGAAAAATQVLAFANNFKQLQTPLSQAAASVAGFTNNVVDLIASQPVLTAQVAAATVALAAFGPQIATATGRLIKLATAAAGAKAPLQELLNTYSKLTGAFDGSFAEFDQQFKTEIIEAYRKKLFEISETVSELSRRKKDLQANLDRFNSSSDTAVKIATKLVNVQARLNDELREQKDLLRQVAGVNVTELEASKGRNSISTRERRDTFYDQMEKDFQAVYDALEKQENRVISDLEEKLNINNNIVNSKKKELKVETEIQRRVRESAQRKLTGDRPFGPAGDPSSIQKAGENRERRIREATATAIEADRKWLQAREQGLIEAAQRGLTAELDAIETRLSAAIKADNAIQANWDARFKARVAAEQVRERARLSADKQRAQRNQAYAKQEKEIRDKADARRAKFNKRTSRFGEDLALGAGFPLLFGAGPGGIAGGVAGAVAGGGKGGFGLQILLSALGTQLDAFVADLGALGGALTKVEGLLSVATEKLLISTKAREKELQTLAKLGFTDLADSLAKTEIENLVGRDAVANLENLASEFDTFGRTVAALTTSLGAFIAGPLAEFLRAINGGNSKDQAVKSFSLARVREGDLRIKEQGATTEDQQIKIRQKVTKEYNAALQKIVKTKKEELSVTTLTNEQKAVAYAQAQQELQRPGGQLQGEAAARNALAGLNLKQGIQSNQLQVLNTAEKYANIAKKQQEEQARFDKQRVEIVRSYEESIAQTREKVEQRILNLRIQGIQKANEIENQRASNQLSELRASNRSASQQQRADAVSTGTRPEFAATAQTIDDAFRAIAEEELSAEQKKAQIKRDAAFEVLKLELEAEKFKVEIAKEVSRLNLQTARRIEQINLGITKRNEDFSTKKFNIEKQIALTQLEILKQEQALLLVQIKMSEMFMADSLQWQTFISGLIGSIEKASDLLEKAKAPGKLQTLAPVGGESVAYEGADIALNNLIERQRQLTAERLKDVDILKAANKEAELLKITNVTIENQATVRNLLLEQLDALGAQQRILELQTEGRSEAQAIAIQQVETTFKLVDGNLAVAEAKLKGQLAALEAVDADKQDLAVITKVREELEKIANLRAGLPAEQEKAIKSAVDLNQGLTETEQLATDIAGTLSSGITDALVLAVSGTEDLGRAFQELASDILAAVGKALILAAVTKIIGGVGSGTTPGTGILGELFKAEGGPVKGNQPYIVGEQGPELFVPNISGNIISNDAFSTARQSMTSSRSVQTSAAATEREQEQLEVMQSPSSLDVRFETYSIGGMDVVTRDEAMKISEQSAKKARAQVFADMRNRPSTRAKLGIS